MKLYLSMLVQELAVEPFIFLLPNGAFFYLCRMTIAVLLSPLYGFNKVGRERSARFTQGNTTLN